MKRNHSGTQVAYHCRGALFCLLLLAPLLCAQPTYPPVPAQTPQSASAISQSGLLPMFAIDLEIEPSWVDGSSFPSSSPKYPNGVSNALQQTWDLLKQGGFNILRFPLSTGDPQSATRMANLCAWAKSNNVLIIPVLNLGDKPESSAGFVKALVTTMRSGGADQMSAYSQIAFYQLGDRLNQSGLHRGQSKQQVAQQALVAADAVRKAEVDALQGTSVQPTPIMVSASYDYELVQQGLISGVPLDPTAQARATSALTDFLSTFASSPDVEAITVEWLPRSLSAGDVDGFATLLQAVKTAAPGKQLALASGFSSAFHTLDEQQQFLVLTATNLANLRASEGANAAFVGLIYRNALNRGETARKNEPNVSQWQWPQRAKELQDLWSGGKGSADIKWWLGKTEANLGIVKLSGSAPAPLPALQVFQQISTSAQQATQAVLPSAVYPVAPSTSPYPSGEAATVQQYPSGTGAAQYPGATPDSSAAQNPNNQNPYPATTTGVGNPGNPYVVGVGGASGPNGTPMMVGGTPTQQAIFSIVMQFTSQLTTALSTKLQSGGTGRNQNYGYPSTSGPQGTQSYSGSLYPSGSPPVSTQNQPMNAPGDPNAPATAGGAYGAPSVGSVSDATAVNNASAAAGSTGAADIGSVATGATASPGPPPTILSFGLMQDATPWRIKTSKKPLFMQALILQLNNPSDSATVAVDAEVQMDNKVVMTRPVGPMLARQSRSIVFGVPTSPGQHNLQVNLKGPQGTVDSTTAVVTTSATGTASDDSGSASVAPGTAPVGPTASAGAPAGSNSFPGGDTGGTGTGTGTGSGTRSGGRSLVPRGMIRLTLPGMVRASALSAPTATSGKGPVLPPRPLPPSQNSGNTSVRSLVIPPRPGTNTKVPMSTGNLKFGNPISGNPKSANSMFGMPRPGTNSATNNGNNKALTTAKPVGSSKERLVRPRANSATASSNLSSSTSSTKSHPQTGSSGLPPRPGPATSTGVNNSGLPPRPGPATTTGANNSGPPQRPGTTANSVLVRPGPTVSTGGKTRAQTSGGIPKTALKLNCVPVSQASQQKNLPACKPGQSVNCAKPICK